jgi:hypothetical protein
MSGLDILILTGLVEGGLFILVLRERSHLPAPKRARWR